MIHVLERVASPSTRDSGACKDDHGTKGPQDGYSKNEFIDDRSEDKLKFGSLWDRYCPSS